MTSVTAPTELGYSVGTFLDQKHQVLIEVPKEYLSSGQLTLSFTASTNESTTNESAGIDDLKIVTCGPSSSTERAPAYDASIERSSAFDAGVNGDPLIMGLSGQLFFFEGRSGGWYSAVSTPSFQWNLKVQNYETCPHHSNTFVSGAGFTFFKNGLATKSIAVSVVNAYNVDTGCGASNPDYCLGAGSLEIMIDGIKHTVGGSYHTKDKSTRVIAYNTFFQCSRKWYDFDVRPSIKKEAVSLRSGRQLETDNPDDDPSIFDVMDGLRGTMIDRGECDKWIQTRKRYSDLFQQAGHYTTVILQAEEVTFHLEYKQESERCQAHSIDVWISSVSPCLLAEEWEGVIGETKNIAYISDGDRIVHWLGGRLY